MPKAKDAVSADPELSHNVHLLCQSHLCKAEGSRVPESLHSCPDPCRLPLCARFKDAPNVFIVWTRSVGTDVKIKIMHIDIIMRRVIMQTDFWNLGCLC